MSFLRCAAYAAMVCTVVYGAACVKSKHTDLERVQARIDKVDYYLPVAAETMATYLAVKSQSRETDPLEWQKTTKLVRDLALVSDGLVSVEGAWVALVNQRAGGALSVEAAGELQKLTDRQWRQLELLVLQVDSSALGSDEARLMLTVGMARMRLRLKQVQERWIALSGSREGEGDILTWNPFDVKLWYASLPSEYLMPPLSISAKSDTTSQFCDAYFAICLATGGSLVDCYAQLCSCSDCDQPTPQGGE